ncbi:MAG: hypothetical protein IPH53_01990 [Flavobacteriales bacterium]|nr:hypothetical protein [Flavobacteriales bacterium]
MNAIEAQDLSILRAQYDWSVDPAWDPSWSVGIAAGPEILDETLSIRLRNIKPEFLSVFFERRRVIRFTDQASIRAFGHVSVPESLDPLADRQLSAPADPNGQPHPLWFNVRLDLFAAGSCVLMDHGMNFTLREACSAPRCGPRSRTKKPGATRSM